MIRFKKYNSIENTFDKDFMEKIRLEELDKQEFVVQEKVHGSNFCFVTDGTIVSAGKRTGFIETDEKFYDYEELLETYKQRVTTLFSVVKTEHPDAQILTIFGEMFGGKYPHPEVKNNNNTMVIQKGVHYCPQHEFYAFDLYVSVSETGYFLAHDEANKLFEQGGFFYAKPLFRGSFADCLKYPNEFPSQISVWLGLPRIDDNICEGVVIRPIVPCYMRNGTRVLLKSKNERFAEKKAIKKRAPKLLIEPTYSAELNALLPITEEYIIENRLNNVISHIGQISLPREAGKLIGLFSRDILDDFLKEHSGDYAAIEKSEQKILNRHINMKATALIKKTLFR